ncbi:MAG: cytochrome c biogenesis heme-transporting ATPase CcmA [Alphaproteobacteria bacterium]|nr:cytochrome c biogenesis heme-transporting ATPase CcmA [Alphaproteobacteria bacterium]
MSPPLLEVRDLLCERGQKPLFQGVSWTLSEGQWLHLQGANGAGKTSLLRIVAGLSPADAGMVLWRGVPAHHAESGFSQDRLYMGHQLALKEELSALENLLFDAAISGASLSPHQALDALAEQGLAGREHLPLRVLSQGQKRRCALARLRPGAVRLWLLDEPFVALDAAAVQQLGDLLGRHVAMGGSVLFTSHQAVDLPGQGSTYRLAS